MTLNYKKLSRKPRLFRTFTGFAQDEFDRIFRKINEGYETYEKERLNRKDRKRAIGAGRKFKLQLRERFLMLLVYYRLYITYTLAGFLFDVDQSTIYRNIRHLEPLVKECIPLPEKIEDKIERIRNIDELLEILPEMEAFVDATEQEIPRPKDKEKRKEYYSGKRKRHTIKTQIATNKDG